MKAIQLTKKDSKGRYVVDLPTALPKWAGHIVGILESGSLEFPDEIRDLNSAAVSLGSDAFKLVAKPENKVESDLRPLRQQALDVTRRWFSIEFRLDVREVMNG